VGRLYLDANIKSFSTTNKRTTRSMHYDVYLQGAVFRCLLVGRPFFFGDLLGVVSIALVPVVFAGDTAVAPSGEIVGSNGGRECLPVDGTRRGTSTRFQSSLWAASLPSLDFLNFLKSLCTFLAFLAVELVAEGR
jgi:hypothetical protein